MRAILRLTGEECTEAPSWLDDMTTLSEMARHTKATKPEVREALDWAKASGTVALGVTVDTSSLSEAAGEVLGWLGLSADQAADSIIQLFLDSYGVAMLRTWESYQEEMTRRLRPWEPTEDFRMVWARWGWASMSAGMEATIPDSLRQSG